MKAARALWLGGALCIGGIVVGAQLRAPAVAPAAADPADSAESQSDSRLVASFTDFAGSENNARKLVAGLRHGGEIALNAPGAVGPGAADTRFTLPTRPMDYGNTRTSLTLAREQLAQLGIRQPTPAQIKAVLTGGAVTSRSAARTTPVLLPGVLQMRAHGMGWGKIADSMGIKLGDSLDGKRNTPAAGGGGSAPAATGIAASAVTVTGAQFEPPKQARAGSVPEAATKSAIRPGRGARAAALSETVPAGTKSADSETRRGVPRAAAPTDRDAATASAGQGAGTSAAGAGPSSAGLSQVLEIPESGATVAKEGRIAGAAAVTAAQGPAPEPVALTPAPRLEMPGPAGERSRSPEPAAAPTE